jgi:hypothetical protein
MAQYKQYQFINTTKRNEIDRNYKQNCRNTVDVDPTNSVRLQWSSVTWTGRTCNVINYITKHLEQVTGKKLLLSGGSNQ